MNNDIEIHELVAQASMGDRPCMEKLLLLTRPRLFAYLYRLTMDYHAAEDLLQQVQMEIVQSLWRLKKPGLFWPWIYKFAWGKAQHHFRDRKKKKTVSLSEFQDDTLLPVEADPEDLGISPNRRVEYQELLEATIKAIGKLKLKHRTILTMRCYEEMSFAEIADFLECSESSARVSFFRIRRKLRSQLRRRGFRAGLLLAGLSLFGTATARAAAKATLSASSKSVTTVGAYSLHIGFWANLIGTLTTEIGILLSTLATMVVGWISLLHMGTMLVVFALIFPFVLIGILVVLYSEQ